jgi:riboflavin kinase/FMN adenylyltransferase
MAESSLAIPLDLCLETRLDFEKPLYLAIGNFDGVHKGHLTLISNLLRLARENNGIAAALTFLPHPGQYFEVEHFFLLQPFDEKVKCIKKQGVEKIFIMDFDKRLSSMHASEFFSVLKTKIPQLSTVVVGENFHCGCDKIPAADLTCICQNLEVELLLQPVLELEQQIVSSSTLRGLIRHGDVKNYQMLAGRPFEVSSEVIHGKKRGRTMGFPTANIQVPEFPLKRGVYFCVGEFPELDCQGFTLVNVGLCPTFGQKQLQIEAHFPGWNKDLYHKTMRLSFIERIRDERKFDSMDALVAQLRIDMEKYEICVNHSRGEA